MDIVSTLVVSILCFLTCSVQQVQCVGFHLPDPESFTYSCTSMGSWSVTGNVTLTEGDLEFFSTNMTLKINGRNLCNIDLATCPELAMSSSSITNSSPNVCKCVSRFSEDDYSIYIRQEIVSADVGSMLTIIVPGQEKYGPLQSTHDIGRIPGKVDGKITYQINSGLPIQLTSEQNVTTCRGEPLTITVCAPDAHQGTVLKIRELYQTMTSSNSCIHIVDYFSFQKTDSYTVVFTYDEGAGCPFQENFTFHVQEQMNGCLSTSISTTTSLETPTSTSVKMASTAPTPAPTTSPNLPCPETPISPPLQQVTLYNGIKVLCDTWTKGGNWVIIQRRTKGDVDFFRGWADYVAGFGDLDGDHWMGLQDIHALCPPSKPCSLRIHLKDDKVHGSSVTEWAEYSNFSLGGFTEHYRLSISGYDHSSTVSDALNYHDGMPFSTYDRDNDPHTTYNCADARHGAWWYKTCAYSDLNGKWGDSSYGLYWTNSKAIHATYSEMKVRLHP